MLLQVAPVALAPYADGLLFFFGQFQIGKKIIPDRLVKQIAEAEGITEQLKAENQMEWVGRMNNIRSRAIEVVNSELIYGRDPAARISTSAETLEPPKVFWKYYDLYRRKRISLSEYAAATGLSAFAIRHFLKNVVEKSPKAIEKPKQI